MFNSTIIHKSPKPEAIKCLPMEEITILFLGQSGLSDSKEKQKNIFLCISVFKILKYLLYPSSLKN